MPSPHIRSAWQNQWEPFGRIRLATSIICIAFAVGIFLSFALWISTRTFPLVPAVQMLPQVSFPFDYVLCIALLILLLITSCSAKKPRVLILCVVALTTVLMLLDQSRLQPWAYQYLCMLVILGSFTWQKENREEQSTILHACRMIVAFVYIWSGIQKMNPFFMLDLYPWMISSVTDDIPHFATEALLSCRWLIPFIESGIGIGLLYKKSREVSLVLAILMCAFIFWTIGPTGHNWNAVVWPWDVALLLLTLVLFAGGEAFSATTIITAPYTALQRIVLCAFCVLPVLSFWNLWDAYLSFAVYSGNVTTATIEIRDHVIESLPDEVRQHIGAGRNILTLTPWTMGELHITPYPEKRIYLAVGRYICSFADNPDDVQLTIHTPNSWTHTFTKETLDCELMGVPL